MAKLVKNPHAVALGRLGGKKGVPARARSLSADECTESATKAGEGRRYCTGEEDDQGTAQ